MPGAAQSLKSACTETFFGANGVTNEQGTTARTGFWVAIQVLNDAVFTTFTEEGSDGGNDGLLTITIPAGTTLYNAFGITAFTLASGAVRAYKG